MSRGHSHVRVDGRGRSWAVGCSSGARVVLRATPAEADTGVADRIALHLVDGHLSSVALDELDETAAFSRRDLDVGDFAESLEERTKLVLGNVARKTSNEDRGVVGVSELVHWLRSTVEAHRGTTHGSRRVDASGTRHAHTARTDARTLVLGGGSRDTHWAITAVDTLHLTQSALLVVLVGETDETISTRHTTDGVSHDLGGLARWETALEERNEDVFVDFRAEITHEDRVFRAALVTAAVGESTTGSPVELESASRVRHGGTVEGKSLAGGSSVREIDKTVTGIASTVNINPV